MSPMLISLDKLCSFLEQCYHAPVQFGHHEPCCTHRWSQHIQTHHLCVLQSLGSFPMRPPVSCSPSLQIPCVLRPSLLSQNGWLFHRGASLQPCPSGEHIYLAVFRPCLRFDRTAATTAWKTPCRRSSKVTSDTCFCHVRAWLGSAFVAHQERNRTHRTCS